MAETNRHYLRCRGCLQRVYVETPKEQRFFGPTKCTACGWFMHHEGILNVRTNRVQETFTATTCDEQCTHALGLDCWCKCGGLYHGTGATVTYTVDKGTAWVNTIASDSAVRIANEYGAALAALRLTVQDIAVRRTLGQWVSRPDFDKWLEVDRRIRKSETLKTHTKRMEVLNG